MVLLRRDNVSLKGYFKKNKKRLRRRKKLIVFLSIIAILGMSTATFAWFTVNTFAGVEDFELDISTGEDLRVSMENHGSDIEKYVHVVTNEMVNSYLKKDNTNLNKLILSPVTTDNGKKYTFQFGAPAKANEHYLEFKVWFIATCDMYVHLTTEGTDDDEHDHIKGTSVTTKESAPKSDIIKAIRMSFDDNSKYKTYEPNKGTKVTNLTTFDLPKGKMNYNDSNQLFHLEKLTPKQVTLRLWAEGEDPECDNDVRSSSFKIELSFLGCDENGNPIS